MALNSGEASPWLKASKFNVFRAFGCLQILEGLPGTAQVRPHLGSRLSNLRFSFISKHGFQIYDFPLFPSIWRPPNAWRPSWDSPGVASSGLKASKFIIFRASGGLQMFGGLLWTDQEKPHLGSRPPNLDFPCIFPSKYLEAFLGQPT